MSRELTPAVGTDRAPDRGVRRRKSERGMTTAEYAVGTVGACGFGTILYQLLTSGWAQQLLQSIIEKVLSLLPF
jgi:Protein of unknown function (DUF4244)